jgi:hypothetical protein
MSLEVLKKVIQNLIHSCINMSIVRRVTVLFSYIIVLKCSFASGYQRRCIIINVAKFYEVISLKIEHMYSIWTDVSVSDLEATQKKTQLYQSIYCST